MTSIIPRSARPDPIALRQQIGEAVYVKGSGYAKRVLSGFNAKYRDGDMDKVPDKELPALAEHLGLESADSIPDGFDADANGSEPADSDADGNNAAESLSDLVDKQSEPAISSPLDGALYMASRGARVAQITKPGAKSPPIGDWPKLATTNKEQIDSWAIQYPDCNWLVHCVDLLVLDVDNKSGKNGAESLNALIDKHGAIPETFTVGTPSGGQHIYFQCKGGVRNSAGKLGEGLDVRSASGYVLCPGSVVEGKPYIVTSAAKVAKAPTWLIDLAGRPKERTPDANTPARNDVDPEAAARQFAAYLEKQDAATPGNRNNAANTHATIARRYGVPEPDVLPLLRGHWNDGGLDDAELERTIRSVYDSGAIAAGTFHSVASVGEFEVVEGAQPAAVDGSQNDTGDMGATGEPGDEETTAGVMPRLIHAGSLTAPPVWTCDYLIKGWISQGSDAQMFGEFGQGKTFMALNMAAHVAAGKPWFGNRVKPAGVLYLMYEGHQGLKRRIVALKRQYSEWPWPSIPFEVLPINAPLVSDREGDQNQLPGRKQLQAAVQIFSKRWGEAPRLIVIDTYSRAIGGDASSETLAQRFAQMAGALIRDYGATVLRIHHPGHKDKGRGRGAYAAPAGLDTDIKLHNNMVEAVKERDSGNAVFGFTLCPVELGRDEDGDRMTSCIVEPTGWQGKVTETESKVVDAIQTLLPENQFEIDWTEVQTALLEREDIKSASAARNHRLALVKKGILDYDDRSGRVTLKPFPAPPVSSDEFEGAADDAEAAA